MIDFIISFALSWVVKVWTTYGEGKRETVGVKYSEQLVAKSKLNMKAKRHVGQGSLLGILHCNLCSRGSREQRVGECM